MTEKAGSSIADFGLAGLTVKEPKDASAGRQPVMLMGTPFYMAPEQLKTPWKVDRRTDIYALGVVAYEMLTGAPPRGDFGPPSEKSSLDPSLDRVVMKALAREPRHRYQSANDLRAAVEKATGRYHNMPGDLHRGAGRRKWGWLPRFALTAVTVWLTIVTYILLKERLAEQKTVEIRPPPSRPSRQIRRGSALAGAW